MSSPQPWHKQSVDRLSSLAELLIEPSQSIDEDQRHRARLLSALVLISTICMWMGVFAGADFVLQSAILGVPVYLLSRSRFLHYARWLSVPFFIFPSAIGVLESLDQEVYLILPRLHWFVLPLLFISLVASVRHTAIVSVLLCVGIFVLANIYSEVDRGIWFDAFGFLLTTGILIIAATLIRERFFRQLQRNLQKIQTAQGDLEQANMQLTTEVAEREQAQRVAAVARDQALETLRLKSQILANVSHDARTPLSVIMLRAELMKRGTYGELNARQLEMLDTIMFSGRDLIGFIDNLLRASRLDNTDKVEPDFSEIVLDDWLDKFKATVKPLADYKELTLTVVVAENMPGTVQSDSGWLQHILNNLTSNAIKFTDEGAITICVFRPDEDRWALSVGDTGWGIPTDAQEHIFKAFWQVDGSTTRKTSRGVGLGLSIVDNLTQLLGGRVEVESELGTGSTFTVFLPLKREAINVTDQQ